MRSEYILRQSVEKSGADSLLNLALQLDVAWPIGIFIVGTTIVGTVMIVSLLTL